MKKPMTFRHEFVESFPETVDQGVVYISMPYATATHRCACGCGIEVVTPFSPTDWQLWFDGVSISLTPSIGNWNFPCRSHYFIHHNKIQWARQWSQQEIEAGRAYDRDAKDQHFASAPVLSPSKNAKTRKSGWKKFRDMFS